MRNLLTVLRHHGNRKTARATFLEQMANFFQQLTDEFFSIASPPTLAAHEFCSDCVGKRRTSPCGQSLQEFSAGSDGIFYSGKKLAFCLRRATMPNTAVLLLPFAVNWR
jgi:hypothetical protein